MLALLGVGLLISISSLDDFFVDLLGMRVSRKPLDHPLALLPARPPGSVNPSIGVFVANWQEVEVLRKMVTGNLARIPYRPLTIYLGVYPNDPETRRVAETLERSHGENVKVIVNSLEGPTSKGQMLNEMFARVFSGPQQAPDLVVLHDSEDVIDPRSLDLFAAFSQRYDYVQIPVFSLEAAERSLVAGTYMEEFAERHMGELLVRDALGAVIPSAGVGTCVSRKLVLHMLSGRGHVLMPGCVTEDYILGAEAHRAGFKCAFTAVVEEDAFNKKHVARTIIATREYFPHRIWASVKQKTRWTYGIAFEGARKLGWRGSAWDVYFFYRDRKGVICNLLPIVSGLLFIVCLAQGYDVDELPEYLEQPFTIVFFLNCLAIAWRLWVRIASFREVHGRYDPIGVTVRWLLAIFINAWAVLRAWRLFLGPSRFATRSVAWSKTQHELPVDFEALKP